MSTKKPAKPGTLKTRFIVDNQELWPNHWVGHYATVHEAERAARQHTAKYGRECLIYDREVFKPHWRTGQPDLQQMVLIATTLKDPLDRVWTQVAAAPGRVALL